MSNYSDLVKTIAMTARQNHEFVNLESMMYDIAAECAKNIDDKPMNEAIGIATNMFEDVVNLAWKSLYLIPTIPLEDKPEKWVIVEDSPMLGKDIKISRTETIHIDMMERHVDTIDGSPAAVYRFNANSRFAVMLYGNTIIEYETEDGENMKLTKSYSCVSFIQSFPFNVPYPTVTTVIHVKDNETGEMVYGFISDIRNLSREEVSAEDLEHHFFSPAGTSLFPAEETAPMESTSDNSNK